MIYKNANRCQPAKGVSDQRPERCGVIGRIDIRYEFFFQELSEFLAPARCRIVGYMRWRQVASSISIKYANNNRFWQCQVAIHSAQLVNEAICNLEISIPVKHIDDRKVPIGK